MALSFLSHQPTFDETDSDDFLSLDFLGDEYEKSLRPSLAEKLQVGFLVSDQFTQTDVTEVLDVKQMSTTVDRLVKDMSALKRNFEFTKQVLKASFEEKLQDKAFELYGKLNDKLRDLQSIHEERVDVVRRSFKQQLQDALVRMASYYKKYYEERLAGKLSSSSNTKSKARIANLEKELRSCQTLVQVLNKQIDELKHELKEKSAVKIEPDTKELDAAIEQNKILEMEILKLSDKNDELAGTNRNLNDRVYELEEDLKEARIEIDQEKEENRKLLSEVDEAKKTIDAERMETSKQLDLQKMAIERDLATELSRKEARAADSARESQRQLDELEATLEGRMAEERRRYELRISELIAEDQRKNQMMTNTTAMERVIEQQKQDITVLRQRLLRVQAQWEKKFAIIKASMHALKDEAYIRMQLQKQSATLKYASISYGPDNRAIAGTQESQPLHQIEPGPTRTKPFLPASKPLPAITRAGRLITGKHTLSLPSGVGTEPFANDVDEDEDLEPDGEFIPLPQKTPSVGDYMPIAN